MGNITKLKIAIIGSGFSGLSAAAILAKSGHDVTVFEKNKELGGRARQFKEKGYTFDMGPSWYWMADIFDKFFEQFDKKTKDYYSIIQLDPGFKIIFQKQKELSLPSNWNDICNTFEKIENGSSIKLNEFMKEAGHKYSVAMTSLVYNPGLSITEVLNMNVVSNIFKLDLLSSYRKHVKKYFNHPELIALLEFPVLFLGTAPENTPAMYSLMAYSGIKKGTFYPMGGFGSVIEGFVKLNKELGVKFHSNEEVIKLNVEENKIKTISTNKSTYNFDIVVGSADYNHIDSKLIDKKYSNYNKAYWEKKTFSPSCLLFYLGVDKKINKLDHHNLFFDEDINNHIDDIYNTKIWPKRPLFYTCCPSKTDSSVAPKGKENLFVLMPIPAGVKDNDETREKYFKILINRLEKYTGEPIKQNIEYKRSYCVNDFIEDYHAYKGNAYGLANTLNQTANLKPKIINRKIKNLYYTGQLTVPGPGVPPSIISGQVVAEYINKINR